MRFGTAPATKPVERIGSIVIHEMRRLVEPSRGERFVAPMDRHLRRWTSTHSLERRACGA